jgi:hypothetical protein
MRHSDHMTRHRSAHAARIRLVSDAVVASYIHDISPRAERVARAAVPADDPRPFNAEAPRGGASE